LQDTVHWATRHTLFSEGCMLNQWVFKAKDESSDAGYAMIIVCATTQLTAYRLMRQEIKDKGREDLDMKLISVTKMGRSLIFSNVETKHVI